MLKPSPSTFCFLFLPSISSNSNFPIITHQFILLALALRGQQEAIKETEQQ